MVAGADAVSLVIRLAEAEDVPRLVELCGLLDLKLEQRLDIDRARQHFQKLKSRSEHMIYVAERDRQVVGTFALIFVGGLAHAARESCIVEDVAVARECQGMGIGKSMMRYAMAVCASRACYKLVLSSHLDRAAAHRFYEGLGFRVHGYSFLIDSLDSRPPDH